jgi:FMN phosphatase YigB (HAD superfamily)
MNDKIRSICFDWGGTLMSELGPQDRAMCFWPEVQVLEGVLDCIHALHPKFTLCIASNATISGHREIQRALDRGGIGKYFTHIFCHMDLGMKKDQPAFWEAVARTLGHPLSQVAMVGDSMQYDAIAPRRFGIRAYWLNRDGQSHRGHESVPQVASLDQFAAAVANAA